MFVPTDKYITINEDRAEELKDTYGDEIVEEKTTFSFDETMIEKYGEEEFNKTYSTQDCIDVWIMLNSAWQVDQ